MITLLSTSSIKYRALKRVFNEDIKQFANFDKNQIEQPIGVRGGYAAAKNRIKCFKESGADFGDFVFVIESYMDFEGRDYACIIMIHNGVEYLHHEFCAKADDMDLFQKVLDGLNHEYGCTDVSYGLLVHQQDGSNPKDWMSSRLGISREDALVKGIKNLLEKYHFKF